MRKDLVKVLADTGRRGGDDSFLRSERHKTKQQLKDPDGFAEEYLPPITGLQMMRGWKHRERPHPAIRYTVFYKCLLAQVGRPWDDVYSELCKLFSNDCEVSREFKWQLKYYIEDRQIRIIDGIPHEHLIYRYCTRKEEDWVPITGGFYLSSFYCHPETGLLCIVKSSGHKWRYDRNAGKIEQIQIGNDPLLRYCNVNGIWYEVKFKQASLQEQMYLCPFTKCVHKRLNWDMPYEDLLFKDYTGGSDYVRRYGLHDGKQIFPITKRQLNKREIKRLKSMKRMFT